MEVRKMLAVGMFSAMAVIGIGNASDSVASEANQAGLIEERVGHGGSIYYKGGQVVSGCTVSAAEPNKGELVEERVGHGGSIYSRRPMATQTSDCKVDCGGAIYSYSPRVAH